MKYNLTTIMRRAWALRREKGFTMMTALRLAWAEAKGCKGYAYRKEVGQRPTSAVDCLQSASVASAGLVPVMAELEDARAPISSYLMKLHKAITTDHDQHKFDILRAALLAPVDALGLAVMDGKTVGLCKYACRNA